MAGYPINEEERVQFAATYHHIHMDAKVRAAGTYIPGVDRTSFSFAVPVMPWFGIQLTPISTSPVTNVFKLTAVNSGSASTWNYQAEGDRSSGYCILGRPFLADLYLSHVYPKDQTGQSLITQRLQLIYIDILTRQTMAYKVEQQREGRSINGSAVFSPDTFDFYALNQRDTGASGDFYGFSDIDVKRVPVRANPESSVIRLANDTCRPSTFAGIEYTIEARKARR